MFDLNMKDNLETESTNDSTEKITAGAVFGYLILAALLWSFIRYLLTFVGIEETNFVAIIAVGIVIILIRIAIKK